METANQSLFDVIADGPASELRGGRIRLHATPGGETDRPTDVGHFLVAAPAPDSSAAPIQCFVSTEYRSSRQAIEQAIRKSSLVTGSSAGGVTADVRLRFYWTTPEVERAPRPEGTRPPRLATEADPATAASAEQEAHAAGSASPHVSYVPDTDERVIQTETSVWRRSGLTIFASTIAALAFLVGVALISVTIPHFIGGEEVERPAEAIPDMVVGLLLLVLSLGFLVTDRPMLMLVLGAVLWMLAGGHYTIHGYAGPVESVIAGLGLLAGVCAVFLRRRQARAAESQ